MPGYLILLHGDSLTSRPLAAIMFHLGTMLLSSSIYPSRGNLGLQQRNDHSRTLHDLICRDTGHSWVWLPEVRKFRSVALIDGAAVTVKEIRGWRLCKVDLIGGNACLERAWLR